MKDILETKPQINMDGHYKIQLFNEDGTLEKEVKAKNYVHPSFKWFVENISGKAILGGFSQNFIFGNNFFSGKPYHHDQTALPSNEPFRAASALMTSIILVNNPHEPQPELDTEIEGEFVAYALANRGSTNSSKCGSFNMYESRLGADIIKMVWDFPTMTGNTREITDIYLTPGISATETYNLVNPPYKSAFGSILLGGDIIDGTFEGFQGCNIMQVGGMSCINGDIYFHLQVSTPSSNQMFSHNGITNRAAIFLVKVKNLNINASLTQTMGTVAHFRDYVDDYASFFQTHNDYEIKLKTLVSANTGAVGTLLLNIEEFNGRYYIAYPDDTPPGYNYGPRMVLHELDLTTLETVNRINALTDMGYGQGSYTPFVYVDRENSELYLVAKQYISGYRNTTSAFKVNLTTNTMSSYTFPNNEASHKAMPTNRLNPSKTQFAPIFTAFNGNVAFNDLGNLTHNSLVNVNNIGNRTYPITTSGVPINKYLHAYLQFISKPVNGVNKNLVYLPIILSTNFFSRVKLETPITKQPTQTMKITYELTSNPVSLSVGNYSTNEGL